MSWARIEGVPIGQSWWVAIVADGYLTGNRAGSTGIIIDRIDFACEGEHNPTLVIIPPGLGLPLWVPAGIVADTRRGLFVEGMKSITDWAPFWQIESGADDAGAPWGGAFVYGIGVGDQAGVVDGRPFSIKTEIYLQPGATLVIGPNVAQIDEMDWQIGVFGRAF